MSLIELFILAVGLSMDAFAVSVCKGLAVPKAAARECSLAGLWFGGFQALMPTIGYFLGRSFTRYIESVDHWVAFILLAVIGGNMIRESLGSEEECSNGSMDPKEMFLLAVATSIDALAVGITFAFLQVEILPAVALIGCTTLILSALGVRIGALVGERFQSRAKLFGGLVLIAIGVKILLEHLGVLG